LPDDRAEATRERENNPQSGFDKKSRGGGKWVVARTPRGSETCGPGGGWGGFSAKSPAKTSQELEVR